MVEKASDFDNRTGQENAIGVRARKPEVTFTPHISLNEKMHGLRYRMDKTHQLIGHFFFAHLLQAFWKMLQDISCLA